MGTECDHGFLWKPVSGDRGAAVTTFSGYLDRVDSGLNQLWINICGFKDVDGTWQSADPTGVTACDTVVEKAFEVFVRDFASTGLNDFITALKAQLTPATVYFPPGVYKFNNRIRRPYYVTLAGAGAQSTFLQASSSFTTSLTDGFALVGQNGDFDEGLDGEPYAISSMSLYLDALRNITLDIYSAGVDGLCAYWGEGDQRKMRLRQVKILGNIYRTSPGLIGILMTKYRYDVPTAAWTTDMLSHNGFRVYDLEIYGCMHNVYGGLFIQGFGDCQGLRFELFNSTACGPLYFGCYASDFQMCSPQGCIDEYNSTTGVGFHARMVLTNGPNYFSPGNYFDALPGWAFKTVKPTYQISAALSPFVEGGGGVYRMETGQTGPSSADQIKSFGTHWLPASKADTNKVTIKNLDGSLSVPLGGTLGYAPWWIMDATGLDPFIMSAISYPRGTHTGGNSSSSLVDSAHDFTALGVTAGWVIRNWTQSATCTISAVTDLHTLATDGTFNTGDSYSIFRHYGAHTGADGSFTVEDSAANFLAAGNAVAVNDLVASLSSSTTVLKVMRVTAVTATTITFDHIKTFYMSTSSHEYFDTGDNYCVMANTLLTLTTDPPATTAYICRELDYKQGTTKFIDEDQYPGFPDLIRGKAGETIGFPTLAYQNIDDGLWYKADANYPEKAAQAIAINNDEFSSSSITSGNYGYFAAKGVLRSSGETAGTPYYLSATTPGLKTVTKPTGAGKIVQMVGIALAEDRVQIKLDSLKYRLLT